MAEEPQIPREKVVRTMKTDMAEAAAARESSIIELAARGNERRYQEGYVPPHYNRGLNTRALVLTLVVLAVIGAAAGGGFYYWYAFYKNANTQKKELEIPRAFLQIAGTQEIAIKPGDRSGLISELRKQLSDSAGDYTYVPLILSDFATEPNLATPEKFFSILKANPPPDLTPSFSGRWNIYTHSDNIVLIFETKDWRATWGSMLAWENTIGDEFGPILPQTPDSGAHNFSDAVIKNEDARVGNLSLGGTSQIAYAIALRKFLIIASSREELRETLERMVAGPINN